jgi:transcriptional regulator with XRE-family HTH domain
MDILKKINQLRIERNWSIYRLSVESGISQSTLNNMFNRETLPSITTLECICSAYGITLSEFFKEEITFSDSEQELISLYRSASNPTKESILTLLREISKTQ